MATWKRTIPELPQDQVEPILRAFAGLPEFVLPPAPTGHTRHYMPWFKKGPDDRTLVFDAFVVVPRDATLLANWPDAKLDDSQLHVLGRILDNMNTLGRSESWCEATLLDEDMAPATRPEPRYAVIPDLADSPHHVEIEPMLDGDAFKIAGRWRPIEFKRFRRKPNDDGGRRLAGAFRIVFPAPVRGPISFGHSAHYGMGLFAPDSDN